jgi:hypothetical protein
MPFFGYRFAPRLRDLKERRLHLGPGLAVEPLLAPLVDAANPIDVEHIAQHRSGPIESRSSPGHCWRLPKGSVRQPSSFAAIEHDSNPRYRT